MQKFGIVIFSTRTFRRCHQNNHVQIWHQFILLLSIIIDVLCDCILYRLDMEGRALKVTAIQYL